MAQSGDLWLTTSHAGAAQGYNSVARLADGTYVAVRDDQVPGQSDTATSMHLQRLDRDGNPTGPETVLGKGIAPRVAAFADGSFVVTWRGPSLGVSYVLVTNAYGQRYDTAGVPLGAQLSLGYSAGHVQPIALSDGSFIVSTWGQNSKTQGPNGFLSGYTKDGAATSFGVGLADPDSCGIVGPQAVVALPSGGWTVAWLHTCVGPWELRLRTYDAAGTVAASSSIPVPDHTSTIGLAALTNGNLALQWWAVALAANEPVTDMHVMMVAPTALPTTLAGASTVPLQPGRTPLLVQSLADGGFLVPWSALGAGEAHVPVSRFSSRGDPV